MKKALLVIDLQNDYLSTGIYPLWNVEQTIAQIKQHIEIALEQGELVIFIQHISQALFFIEGTKGAEIIDEFTPYLAHPNVLVIQKNFPSSFDATHLLEILTQHQITDLDLCGMMTQNCVLFTAIDEKAKNFNVKVIDTACTSVSEVIHFAGTVGLSRMGLTQTKF